MVQNEPKHIADYKIQTVQFIKSKFVYVIGLKNSKLRYLYSEFGQILRVLWKFRNIERTDN
jgi:CRISPR/Cas system CSM-associated protein Csm2 small subunit